MTPSSMIVIPITSRYNSPSCVSLQPRPAATQHQTPASMSCNLTEQGCLECSPSTRVLRRPIKTTGSSLEPTGGRGPLCQMNIKAEQRRSEHRGALSCHRCHLLSLAPVVCLPVEPCKQAAAYCNSQFNFRFQTIKIY